MVLWMRYAPEDGDGHGTEEKVVGWWSIYSNLGERVYGSTIIPVFLATSFPL